ncbi:MAG: Multidrug resistance protein MdtC [Chlamydiales bacterium]|nr:Multidrug resistance protein MdtC [Chlamydiales bacterium]
MTTLVMIATILFGVFAYRSLPVSDLPNIAYPTITVTALQPGGSPEYMANLVATPMERNFATISGLKTLSSTNTVGQSQIILNFDLNVNLDSKEVEVQQAITESMPNLPPMPTSPTYQKVNPSDTPILFLILTSSSQTLANLYETGYNILAQPISMIEGISEVQVYGYPYAVRVQADPMQLMTHSVDINALEQTLVESNPNLPAGLIQGRYHDWMIQANGMLTEGEDYDGVIINQDNGVPLYVGDVARGVSALEQRDPYFHYMTENTDFNTIVLAVSRLPNSNTLEISKAIFKELTTLKKSIPGSIKLETFYDKSVPIIDSIRDVQLTLIIALVLVVGVIFVYLGKLTETLIPSVVLPTAIVATFIWMYFFGFNIDTLSLLALILSIGFIVDDSVVVLENVVRHIEMEKHPFEAALDGSKQISTTVLTMSLALSAVFIPFVWMPGILGRIFHEFALTIVIAIFCSGFISLTLNPMLCSRYLKMRLKLKDSSNFSERINIKLVNLYEKFLHHSIRFKKTTVFVGILCIGLSLLFTQLLRTDFMPAGNMSILQGLTQCQQGSSKVNTIDHQVKVNEVLRQYPYQDGFLTIAGYPTDDEGLLFMRLVDASKRPNSIKCVEQLRHSVSDVVGINTYLKPFPLINLQVGSSSSLGEYQYILVSTDSKLLYKTAEAFTKKMRELPGLVGVNSDMRNQTPQLNVNIDRDQAGVFGVTAEEIETTFQYAYGGGRISTFFKNNDLYDLILEVAPGFDLTSADLDLLYIKAPETQALVPMTSVATWEEVVAPASVNHLNTFPSVTISFNLAEGEALGPVIKKLDQIAQEIVPTNVISRVEGSAQVFIETFKALKWLILIAIVVIYLLLGVLYESFIHPITVLSALPIATVGGLFTLWIFNIPLSIISIVGLIVLIGLVQKNGIMMIDFALEHMQVYNESPKTAIIEACRARFRPILMTTLAAMMGALPIAIGFGANASVNRPLGLVIFGGLLFSQLITLFVTPVVFLYMQQLQDWLTHRKKPESVA